MIRVKNNLFCLETINTSYLFYINENELCEHLYYGKRLKNPEYDISLLREKNEISKPLYPYLSDSKERYQPYVNMSEFSLEGLGDYKTPLLSITYSKEKLKTLDLRYNKYYAFKGVERFNSELFQAIGTESDALGVALEFIDPIAKVRATFIYTVFTNSDVITRRVKLENYGEDDVTIDSIYSLQLDLPTSDYTLSTFNGAPYRERVENKRPINGKIINESRFGASSCEANPGIILESRSTNEAYMVNLIYSGSHKEVVEVTAHSKTHLLIGLNDDCFEYNLESKMVFESPEAILCYSHIGREDLKLRVHSFIKNHIQRGQWKNRIRPITYNTFSHLRADVEEDKVAKLIKKAGELGFEAFVLDDGWFGSRTNDYTSFGDWSVNTSKIPSGLSYLSSLCHKNRMLFGLMVEPEMISKSSYIYKKHPDWILLDKRRKVNALYEDRYLLDITRKDVQEYIIDALSLLIQNCSVDYLKWSFNRYISDIYSQNVSNMGEYEYRYILSLNKLQREICTTFPNLYLEGSNARFDLSSLVYNAAISSFEDQDIFSHLKTIEGTYSLYPSNMMTNIVVDNPNRVTMRSIDLTSRFNIALFGCLSYSLDLFKDSNEIKNQLEFYKMYRQVLQFGIFEKQSDDTYLIYSPDRTTILLLNFISELRPNSSRDILRVRCANESMLYKVFAFDNKKTPLWDLGNSMIDNNSNDEYYEVSGDTLKWAGIKLFDKISTNLYNENQRIMPDFSARLYVIRKK